MRVYRPKPGSKYYIEPEKYSHVVAWCRCYPLWVKELETLPDTSRAITYDKDKVQTSISTDPTSELAMRRIGIERKKNLLETTIQAVSPEIYAWMLKGITNRGLTARDLIQQGMPCGRNYYSRKKAQIYYQLSKKI
jgi:hypothetical protein